MPRVKLYPHREVTCCRVRLYVLLMCLLFYTRTERHACEQKEVMMPDAALPHAAQRPCPGVRAPGSVSMMSGLALQFHFQTPQSEHSLQNPISRNLSIYLSIYQSGPNQGRINGAACCVAFVLWLFCGVRVCGRYGLVCRQSA